MPSRASPISSPTGLAAEIGKKRPYDVPEVEVFLNILRTCSLLTAETGRFLKKYGLTEAQYNALRILRGHGEAGIPSQTIGEQLVAQVPDVTRLVDRLVEAKFAERDRTAADRRVVMVCITRAGLDLLAKIDRPLLDLHRSQLGHLSKAEMKHLSGLLVKARSRPDGPEDGEIGRRCP
jgi:DNA-binding MarR family transcriptional regulator